MKKDNPVTIFYNLADIYETMCQPICKEMGVTHTAFTILMFLADYPEYDTAKDICKFRAIRPNIVSFNVEKLVQAGYVERQAIPGNRRSIRLVCTKKAGTVVEKGHDIMLQFRSALMNGMPKEDVGRFYSYLELISENIMELRESLTKKYMIRV